jgi:hypothetical protein
MNKAEKAVFEIQKQMYKDKEFFAKSANNPFYKSKYVPLNDILWKLNPKLHEHGCMMYHTVTSTEHPSLVTVTCVVKHEAGDVFTASTVIPIEKLNPQEGGKATTYGRRYSTTPMFGIPDEDDDGESTMKRTPKQPQSVDVYKELSERTGMSITDIKKKLKPLGITTEQKIRDIGGVKIIKILKGETDE